MGNDLTIHQNLIEIARRSEENPFLKKALHTVRKTEKSRFEADNPKETYAILAFDTTGSMNSCIQTVRDNLGTIVDNLVENEGVNIMLAGVGEYCDAPNIVQINDFTKDRAKLRESIDNIKNTGGGGAGQVSLELLWQNLNENYIEPDKKYVMVLISDEIAHGQDTKEGSPRADYKKELAYLRKNVEAFYFIGCSRDERKISLQKELLQPGSNYDRFFPLSDMNALNDILPDLLVATVKESGKKGAGMNYLTIQIDRQIATGNSQRVAQLQKVQKYLALPPGR